MRPRIIVKRKKYDSITSELIALQQRIKFKVLLLVYKARHKHSPSYTSDLLQLQPPRRQIDWLCVWLFSAVDSLPAAADPDVYWGSLGSFRANSPKILKSSAGSVSDFAI